MKRNLITGLVAISIAVNLFSVLSILQIKGTLNENQRQFDLLKDRYEAFLKIYQEEKEISLAESTHEESILDGQYLTDTSIGEGERDFYFDLIFYPDQKVYVEQHFKNGIVFQVVGEYSYSTQAKSVTFSYLKNNRTETYTLSVSDNRYELYDSGYVLKSQ